MPPRDSSKLALLLVGAIGCGSEPAPPRFGELTTVSGALAMPATAPQSESFGSPGAVVDIEAVGELVVVGTTEGAYAAGLAELVELEVWSDEAQAPARSGPVSAMARYRDAVLVLAEHGAFHTFGERLLIAPEGEQLLDLEVRDLAGDERALWLVTAQGAFILEDGALARLAVEGENEAPTAVAASGRIAMMAFGDRLYELELDSGLAHRVPYDTGRVSAMLRGADGGLYLATERGLFVRDPQGAYTRYLLGDDPRPVERLASYPKDGTFALFEDGVALVRPGEGVEGVVAREALPAGIGAFVADDTGSLWIGGSEAAVAYSVGTPISFAADVAPILEVYCATCHASGAAQAPVRDFASYEVAVELADTVIARMTSGQMPPAGSPQPSYGDVDIVRRWHRSGNAP